jgi:hypothetical protein
VAIRILQDRLKSHRQPVNAVLEAQKANHLLVQECFQRITDLSKARDQFLQAQNKIVNMGGEYDSEKGGLSLSQEDDAKIIERANGLRAKKNRLAEDYDVFSESTKKNAGRISDLYNSSNKLLKAITERKSIT